MNKKIGLILALVLVAFLVMGTASAGLFDFLGGSSGDSTANDENTFIVGFDAEFPPYGFKDERESGLFNRLQRSIRSSDFTFALTALQTFCSTMAWCGCEVSIA